MYSVGKSGKLLVKVAIVLRLGELLNEVSKSTECRALDPVRHTCKAASQGIEAGDVELDLGDAVEVGVGRGDVVVVEASELTDVVEYRMYAGECIQKLGDGEKVLYCGLSVGDDLLIRGKILAEVRGLEAEYLGKAKLVADYVGNGGQIGSVSVKNLGFFGRIKQADELVFHHF